MWQVRVRPIQGPSPSQMFSTGSVLMGLCNKPNRFSKHSIWCPTLHNDEDTRDLVMSETFLQPQSSFYFLENSFRMLSTIQDLKNTPPHNTPDDEQSHVKLVLLIQPEFTGLLVLGLSVDVCRWHVDPGVSTHTSGRSERWFHSDHLRPVNMRVDWKVGQTFCGSINSRSSVGFLRVLAGCALSHVAVMNGHIVPPRGGQLLFFWLAATCERFAPSAYLVHPQQLEQNLSKCFGLILQREGDLHR